MAQQRANVGERIKAAREQRGWKQKELAARVHVEPQTISNWERGVSAPDMAKLEILADLLGKTVGYFVSDPAAEAPGREQAELEDMRVVLYAMAEILGLDVDEVLRKPRSPAAEPPPTSEVPGSPGEAGRAA